MNKYVKFGFTFIVIMFLTLFSGCNGNLENDFGSKNESRILQDIFDIDIKPYPEIYPGCTKNDLRISERFGTYNGCVVVMIDGPWGYTQSIINYSVADVNFVWHQGQYPYAWKDGKFYHGLQEAYDAGWLTKNDLEKIASLHNKN